MSASVIKIKDLETEVKVLKETHESTLAAITAERDTLAAWKAENESKIQELDEQVKAKTAELESVNAQAAETAEKLTALEAEKAATEAEIDKLKAALEMQPEETQAKGGEPVNPGNPDSEISTETLSKMSGAERVKAFRSFHRKQA
jgi:septal ring factor EnvC (AmiA/AmiB activator)